MKQALMWIRTIVAITFAVQSLVVSSAMITKTLTVPFLVPCVTVAAGWVTLALIVTAVLVMLFRTLSR